MQVYSYKKGKESLRNFDNDDDGVGVGVVKGRGTLAEHIGSSTVCWTFIVTKGRIGDNLQHSATLYDYLQLSTTPCNTIRLLQYNAYYTTTYLQLSTTPYNTERQYKIN